MARITAAMCAGGRALGDPRLSPDGRRVAFVSSRGTADLVVVDLEGERAGVEVVVATDPPPRRPHGLFGGVLDWLPDGSGLVYAAADGGLWLAPSGGGPARRLAAPSADGPAGAPAVSPDGTRVAYQVEHRVIAIVDLDGGWPQPVSGKADFVLDPAWSPDGQRLAWHEWDVPAMPWDDSRIAVRPADRSGPVTVVAGGDGVAVQQPRWAPDGALAFLCDCDGWLNVWEWRDGEAKPLVAEPHEHGDPAWGPGQRSFTWSPDGSQLAFCRNEGGFGALCLLDRAAGTIDELGRGVHGALSWVGDGLVALRSGARTPTALVRYARPGGERRVLARGPVGGFEEAGLVEPDAVSWRGRDGGTVHGHLYRPAGASDGASPSPLLVWIHGGPTGQWQVTFQPRVAFFVARGWAVLAVDHRGSTGWGRDYLQAMRGGWGDLDVDDTAAGIRHVIEQRWCDPRRVVPIGGSAGGTTVLHLLARHPELCAAGVALYPVTDLLELDETTHRFEQHYFHSIVGPLPECADVYRSRSPVAFADRITAPLLLLHGSADPVVPVAQSQALHARLVARGAAAELHVYDGEGHGWSRPDTVVDELERTESFLRRHVLRWRT